LIIDKFIRTNAGIADDCDGIWLIQMIMTVYGLLYY